MPRFIRNSFLLLLLILAGCIQGQTSETVETAIPEPTHVVVRILNLDLYQTPTDQTVNPTPSLSPTSTTAPTLTEIPPKSIPTLSSLKTPPSCTNKAEFIKHVTISNNTSLASGELYAKIWQVKNIGTCAWGPGYKLIFLSGEQMGGPLEIPLPRTVSPGEIVDLRLDLTAPTFSASHAGKWMLSDPQEQAFGIGIDGQQPLEVVINVKPTARPTPG